MARYGLTLQQDFSKVAEDSNEQSRIIGTVTLTDTNIADLKALNNNNNKIMVNVFESTTADAYIGFRDYTFQPQSGSVDKESKGPSSDNSASAAGQVILGTADAPYFETGATEFRFTLTGNFELNTEYTVEFGIGQAFVGFSLAVEATQTLVPKLKRGSEAGQMDFTLGTSDNAIQLKIKQKENSDGTFAHTVNDVEVTAAKLFNQVIYTAGWSSTGSAAQQTILGKLSDSGITDPNGVVFIDDEGDDGNAETEGRVQASAMTRRDFQGDVDTTLPAMLTGDFLFVTVRVKTTDGQSLTMEYEIPSANERIDDIDSDAIIATLDTNLNMDSNYSRRTYVKGDVGPVEITARPNDLVLDVDEKVEANSLKQLEVTILEGQPIAAAQNGQLSKLELIVTNTDTNKGSITLEMQESLLVDTASGGIRTTEGDTFVYNLVLQEVLTGADTVTDGKIVVGTDTNRSPGLVNLSTDFLATGNTLTFALKSTNHYGETDQGTVPFTRTQDGTALVATSDMTLLDRTPNNMTMVMTESRVSDGNNEVVITIEDAHHSTTDDRDLKVDLTELQLVVTIEPADDTNPHTYTFTLDNSDEFGFYQTTAHAGNTTDTNLDTVEQKFTFSLKNGAAINPDTNITACVASDGETVFDIPSGSQLSVSASAKNNYGTQTDILDGIVPTFQNSGSAANGTGPHTLRNDVPVNYTVDISQPITPDGLEELYITVADETQQFTAGSDNVVDTSDSKVQLTQARLVLTVTDADNSSDTNVYTFTIPAGADGLNLFKLAEDTNLTDLNETDRSQEVFEFKIKQGMTGGDTSESTYNSLVQFLDDTNGVDISPGDKLELSVILDNGYGSSATKTDFTYNGTASTSEFNAREVVADGLKTSVVDKVNSQGMCELEITIEDTVAKFTTTKANPTVEDHTSRLEITALQVDVYVSKDRDEFAGDDNAPLLTDTSSYELFTMNWDETALNNNSFDILRTDYDRSDTSSIINESFKLTIKNNDLLPGSDTSQTLTNFMPQKRVSIVVTATNVYGNGVRRITDSYDGHGINWNSTTVVDSSGHNHDSPYDKNFYERNWGVGTYPTDGQGASTNYSVYSQPGPRTTFKMKSHSLTMETLVETQTFNGLTRDSDLTLNVLLEQTETLSLTGTDASGNVESGKLDIEVIQLDMHTMNSLTAQHQLNRFTFDKNGKKLVQVATTDSQASASELGTFVNYIYDSNGNQEALDQTEYDNSIFVSNYTREVIDDHETQASAQTIQSFAIDFNFDNADTSTRKLGYGLVSKGQIITLKVTAFTNYQLANSTYTNSTGTTSYGNRVGQTTTSVVQYGDSNHSDTGKTNSSRDDTGVTFEEYEYVYLIHPAIFKDSAIINESTVGYNILADVGVVKYNAIINDHFSWVWSYLENSVLDTKYTSDATFVDGDGSSIDRSTAVAGIVNFDSLIEVAGASAFSPAEFGSGSDFRALVAGNGGVFSMNKQGAGNEKWLRIAGLPQFWTATNPGDPSQLRFRPTVTVSLELEFNDSSTAAVREYAVGHAGDFENSTLVAPPAYTTSQYHHTTANTLGGDGTGSTLGLTEEQGYSYFPISAVELNNAFTGKTTFKPLLKVTSTARDGSTFTDTIEGGVYTIVTEVLNFDAATILDEYTDYSVVNVGGRTVNDFKSQLNWTSAANKTNPLTASVELYVYTDEGDGSTAPVTVDDQTGNLTGVNASKYAKLSEVEQYVDASNGDYNDSAKVALITSSSSTSSLTNDLAGNNVEYALGTHLNDGNGASTHLQSALFGSWVVGVAKIESDVIHFSNQSGSFEGHGANRIDNSPGLSESNRQSNTTRYYVTTPVYLYSTPSGTISNGVASYTTNGYTLNLATQLNTTSSGVDDVVLLAHGSNDGLGTIANYNNNTNLLFTKQFEFPAADTITPTDTSETITHAKLTIGDGYNTDTDIIIEFGVTTWATLVTDLDAISHLPNFELKSLNDADDTLRQNNTIYILKGAGGNDIIEASEQIKLVTTTVRLLSTNLQIDYGKIDGTFTSLAPAENPTMTVYQDGGNILGHTAAGMQVLDRSSGNLTSEDIVIAAFTNSNTQNTSTNGATLVSGAVSTQAVLN